MSKSVQRRLAVQTDRPGWVVNCVLGDGASFTTVAFIHGCSRQYISRVFWQEVARRHPEVLARWGEGKPPLSWLRKELRG